MSTLGSPSMERFAFENHQRYGKPTLLSHQPLTGTTPIASKMEKKYPYFLVSGDATQAFRYAYISQVCLNPTQKQCGHLFFSGMWISVDQKTNTKNVCLKQMGLHVQNVLTILGSVFNMIGELIRQIDEHESRL